MRVASLLKAASILAVAALAGAPKIAHAQDAACTVFYKIQPDDTLSKIAQLAYGNSNYQLIFSRNIGVLKDPINLPIGELLMIPCANGITPQFDQVIAEQTNAEEAQTEQANAKEAQAEQANAEEALTELTNAEEAEVATPVVVEETKPPQEPSPQAVIATAAPALTPAVDRLKLLTASGLPPFADKSLRGGGMATELANRSLEKLGIKEASRIVFIDDRDSHLQDLLIDGSFDLGFPWFRTACEQMALLEEMSPKDAWLCKNFSFSEPFYEFVFGFFVPIGEYSQSRTTFLDFSESRICRPSGSSMLDLAFSGLTEDNATFVRPETLIECLMMLKNGEVDAVSGEAFETENLLAELGLFEEIEELPNLGLLQTIHAVAPNEKPGSDDALATMNMGLIELKISGEWFRIVGRHLAKN
ncbi:MAG: transporter substrate-binding domain-containing protein [Paracoccaceae bacterium]|jgi:ABC-type amino acid transport substrate-binding protein|nr:transporter substrate-binding domain-containing protein [Paracoccaceae bacterium]